MKRFLTLAASLVLSTPFAGYAEEPKPKVERLNVLIERPKAEPSATAKSAAAPQAQSVQPGATRALGVMNPWGGGKSAAGWYIEQTDKVAKLSPEQKQKIERLFEMREQETRAIQAAIAAKSQLLSQEMSRAFESKNQEAIAKAQKAYQDLYAPMSEIMKKSNASLQEVLTAEQKAKLQEHRVTSMIAAYAPGATLSEAQLKQIKEAVGQGAGDHEGLERKLPEILGRTLTAEQASEVLRQRLTTFVKMSFGGAKLTAEQQKKVEDRITDLAKGHKQGLQLDPSNYGKVSEFVASLLTPEQKEVQKTQRFSVGGAVGGFRANTSTQPAAQANPSRTPNPSGTAPTNPPAAKPTERKTPEAGQANVKVSQLPGGTFQIIIGEGNEAGAPKPGHEARERAEEVQLRLQGLMKQAHTSHRDGMRERVRRQRELTKKASKLVKKLDELGSDESPKARDLWKQLEQVQAELQQTLGGPQGFSFSAVPGQPAGAWVVQSGAGMVGPGTALLPMRRNQPQTNPAAPRIETLQIVPPTNVAPQPSTAEVMKAIEGLRRQVDELRAQVRKQNEK